MSTLGLEAVCQNGRTVLSDCAFTAPLKVARPFYDHPYTEVMLMAASAGMLDGDRYDISVTVHENAALRFTGQSYTKIFRCNTMGASQNVKLHVKSGGTLIWTPPPVIPFAGSIYQSSTTVYLEPGSRFLMTDILSCGRSGMQEQFAWNSYCSRTLVYLQERPVFLDCQRMVPDVLLPGGLGFFEGYSHTGTAFLYGMDAVLPQGKEIAKTEALEGICIRMLGKSAEEIQNAFGKIYL